MKDGCCTIVPDSRLWMPSRRTTELLKLESFSASIIFEEWLELCCQRYYIIPPSYSRMLIVAEYLRISYGSQDYLEHIKNSALLPFEQEIPQTSDTHQIQNHAFVLDIGTLFSIHPDKWLRTNGAPVIRFLGCMDDSLSVLYMSSMALGSPYRDFTREDWCTYNLAEMKLLHGSQNLYRKLHGFWPSHPFHVYNIRGMGRMHCPGETIKDQRKQWLDDMLKVLQSSGMCTLSS